MEVKTSADGTKLISFDEGYKSVLISSINDKVTVCVSSQVGCGMNCAFCRAGKFVRNLASDEIFSQVSAAAEVAGKVPTAVVVMGMGEPMLNFDSVSSALEKIHDTFSISYRHITLSTCGIHLGKLEDVKYHVAVSLHSAEDSKRENMMPGAASVADVVAFSKKFSDRKYGLMIEYSLISEVNDTDADLDKLLALDWPANTNFNLIEFNDFGEYKKSPRLVEWKEKILAAGYKCFIRASRGADIEAACGMLDLT